MKDPKITQILRPLKEDERDSIIKNGVNFADYDFNIGIYVNVFNIETNLSENSIPEDFARIKVVIGTSYLHKRAISLKPCHQVLA